MRLDGVHKERLDGVLRERHGGVLKETLGGVHKERLDGVHKERHDGVPNNDNLSETAKMIVDLSGEYKIPIHLACTDHRPGLIWWDT